MLRAWLSSSGDDESTGEKSSSPNTVLLKESEVMLPSISTVMAEESTARRGPAGGDANEDSASHSFRTSMPSRRLLLDMLGEHPARIADRRLRKSRPREGPMNERFRDLLAAFSLPSSFLFEDF